MNKFRKKTQLTEAQVREIRFRAERFGAAPRDLADVYRVTPETIRRILRRDQWRELSEEGPGATHEQWTAGRKEVTNEEIEASKQRLAKMLGAARPQDIGLSTATPAAIPTLEEALKAQALKEEAASPGLERLQAESAKLRRGDQVLEELTGHGNVAVVGSPIPATSAEPTDGGRHDEK